MTHTWPQFITADLGESEADDAERTRRWHAYDRAMKDVIAKGGVHQDADGWWVETSTGALIGPDPSIERPADLDEDANAKPFREAFPELADSIDKEVTRRGRPKAETTKTPVTIRLDPDIVDHYKAKGKGWQSQMNDDLRKLAGLH